MITLFTGFTQSPSNFKTLVSSENASSELIKLCSVMYGRIKEKEGECWWVVFQEIKVDQDETKDSAT